MAKAKFGTTKRVALTALLTALVIATSYIPPVPLAVGRIYWCDGMILLAAFLVDPVSAFLAGGLGTFFYDLLIGSAYMAPVSLVIHGLQGALVSLFLHYIFPQKHEGAFAVLSGLIGGIVVIAGYFVYRSFLAGGESSGVAYALSKMPANFIQEGVGIAVAVVVCYAMRLKKLLFKNHLLPPEKEETGKAGQKEVAA